MPKRGGLPTNILKLNKLRNNKMNKKYLLMIIILILVVSASLLFINVKSPTDAVVMEKHYILAQSMAPGSTPTIIANKKGFFAKEGLDIEVKPFTSG